MAPSLLKYSLLAVAFVPHILALNLTSGTGKMGAYWDCCKPSCSWEGKASVLGTPVDTCDAKNNVLTDLTAGSACGDGGTAYTCNNQQAWAVNDTFSYGFASAFVTGGSEDTWCCGCYRIKFVDGGVEGKEMIVQASNTNYNDPKSNVFGVGTPGSFDYASTCAKQYGDTFGFLGANNTGAAVRDDCLKLPKAVQPGCLWRFDWFKNADSPNMTFERVTCPQILTNKTNCIRKDDTTFMTAGATAKNSASISQSWSLGLLTTALFVGLLAV